MSLRARLMLLVAVALLPALAIQAYTELDLRRQRETELHQLALRQARLVQADLESILEGARSLLAAMSHMGAVSGLEGANCNARLAELAPQFSAWRSFAVIDAGERLVCSNLAGENPTDYAKGRVEIEQAMREPGIAVGVYTLGGAEAEPILPMALAFRNPDGSLRGVVLATLSLVWLGDHLREQFHGDAVVVVADRNGTIVSRNLDSENRVGRRYSSEVVKTFINAPEPATQDAVGVDGVRRIYGFIPVGTPFDLYVSVGLDKDPLMAQVDAASLRALAFIVLGGLLAFCAALLVARRFVGTPIEHLVSMARDWSSGDFRRRVALGPRAGELRLIGDAFNAMAERLEAREKEREEVLRALAAGEEALRRANDTLEQRVSERTAALHDANERLVAEIAERRRTEEALVQTQKMEAVGQLTGGVAHDFNNLLTAVLGNLELAQRRVRDEPTLSLLATAVRAAERGAKLTSQLLAFSRRARLDPRPLDLNEAMRGMGELLRRTLGATVRLDEVLAEDLWPALVDANQIELAVLNLALNARDAMPNGGTITLETRNVPQGDPVLPSDLAAGDYVMVAVADAGEGMPPDVAARAFEPFFTTKEVGKGSGLGLSMVHGVVKQSGGSVTIVSRPGEGTVVRLFLPRAAADAGTAPATARGAVIPLRTPRQH
jgi:signal transduction histidine kinase